MAKIKVREAKLSDIPQLVDLMIEFKRGQSALGIKTIAVDDRVLRGGVMLELGSSFESPYWNIIVADKDSDLVGFLIGILEVCAPSDRFEKCVRVAAEYITDTSLGRPRLVAAMWKELEQWGNALGVGYFYAMIHSGNGASIQTAKKAGFKHHTVQFIKMAEPEGEEGVIDGV